MRVSGWVRVAFLCTVAAVGAGCSKGSDSPSPTSPTPSPSGNISYTAIGASDAAGVGSSVVCVPFTACDNGTGYVQVLFRRLQQTGNATLLNLGVPGAVLSPAIEDLGRRVGRSYPGNFLTNQAPFTASSSTVVTVFAGGNDANTIGQVIQDQKTGSDDTRGFIDAQVRQWGDDYASLLRAIRQRAPSTKVVLYNLPNLAGAPYMAGKTTFEKSIMQRIAVGLSERVNALAASNVFVIDMLCDARILEPASFSSDGFHPSDRGYALMAELGFAAATSGSYPSPAGDCAQRRVVPVF